MSVLYYVTFLLYGRWLTHTYMLWSKCLELEWRQLFLYIKGLGLWSGDGIRDWVEKYWQTFHLFSQGCFHRDDPAINEARSGPPCCFRATCGPCLLFSVWHTDAIRETQYPGPKEAHTNTNILTLQLLSTGCYAITTHKTFKDST